MIKIGYKRVIVVGSPITFALGAMSILTWVGGRYKLDECNSQVVSAAWMNTSHIVRDTCTQIDTGSTVLLYLGVIFMFFACWGVAIFVTGKTPA